MTKSKPPSKTTQKVLFVGLVIVVGAAGLYLGMGVRGRWRSTPVIQEIPTSRLIDGSLFPNVSLVGEDGYPYDTHELLAGKGGVVIFVEFGCPPCSVMTAQWQALLDEGKLRDTQVFGITAAPPGMIQQYKTNTNITFPIYCDTEWIFEYEYQVEAFPLRLVVNHALEIRAQTYNAREPVDLKELAALITQ